MAAQNQKGAPPPPDLVEATARRELWRAGTRLPAGTKMQIPRAEYERDRAHWETAEDRQAAARQVIASEEPRKAEQDAFWQRVKSMETAREAQEAAAAKAFEVRMEQNHALAKRAREAAESR